MVGLGGGREGRTHDGEEGDEEEEADAAAEHLVGVGGCEIWAAGGEPGAKRVSLLKSKPSAGVRAKLSNAKYQQAT